MTTAIASNANFASTAARNETNRIAARNAVSAPNTPRTVDILGVPVSAITMASAAETIIGWARRGEARSVCVADVHSIMQAQKNPAHAQALRSADMITPDGKPLSWLARLRGEKTMRQVCGPELLPTVCAMTAGRGIKHYFYGGAPGVAEKLAAKLKQDYAGLEIVGVECPPFRTLSAEEKADVVARIKASGADIVWVGLGCPKQELWCAENVAPIGQATVIGVGAAFDFHTGRIERAPQWMRDAGLEWLHRLASEPKRLWRRYLVLAPQFVGMAARESAARWWQGQPMNAATSTTRATADA